MQATLLWFLWQDLLQPFRPAFTNRGFPRFVQWVTGLVLNVEEHTITQSPGPTHNELIEKQGVTENAL